MNEGEPSGYSAAQGELKAWVPAPGGKQALSSGLTFAQMTTQGCRPVRLGGREVAAVCFKSGGLSFHFYVRPVAAKSERKLGAKPALVAQASTAAAAWSDGRLLYVLAIGAGLDEI